MGGSGVRYRIIASVCLSVFCLAIFLTPSSLRIKYDLINDLINDLIIVIPNIS